MAEVRYEKPLDQYTVDNFIEESRKLVGKPFYSVYEKPLNKVAKRGAIRSFSMGHGDDNPLYNSLTYALKSCWGTLIAPPTFPVTVKFPISYGALYDGPYPLAGLEAGFTWEWFDVVRLNDNLTGDLVLTDVYEKTSEKFQSRVVYLVSECKYWNKVSKELVATCKGTYAAIARAESITEIQDAAEEGFRKQPLVDRELYSYSKEELQRIYQGIEGEVRRGYKPLYWVEAEVGDTLTPVVKGALRISDLMNFHVSRFSKENFPIFAVGYRKMLKIPGFLRTNPLTGWTHDMVESEHCDQNLSEGRGLPTMFAHGALRPDLYTHLLANWMSDYGFIRRLDVDTLEPHLYGDALWMKGTVVEKYKEKLGGRLYGAVGVKLEAINQLGQNVAPGTATVYLPSPGREVELPIPTGAGHSTETPLHTKRMEVE
jgi:acyl dehydratase